MLPESRDQTREDTYADAAKQTWRAAFTLPVVALVSIACLFLLIGMGDLLAWGGELGRHIWIDFGWTLAGTVATAACLSAALRNRGQHRTVWLLFAIGCISWLIGQFAWDYFELFSTFPASPALSDIGYLGMAPACIAGILFMTTRSGMSRILLGLDIVVVVFAFGVVFTTIFFENARASELSTLGRGTALLYPVFYATLMFGLAMASADHAWRNRSVRLLLAGLTGQVVPFILWTPAVLAGTYHEGGIVDVIWMFGLLAIAASALDFETFTIPEPDRQLFGLTAHIPLVMSLTAMLVWLLDLARPDMHTNIRLPLAGLLAGIVGVTALRLALTLRRGGALYGQVQVALEALRDSEQRFRAIFEGAPIGIEIADMEGRLVATNPALQAMLGYSEEELRNVEYTEITHPEDIATEEALDDALVAGAIDRYQLEKRHIRKDGEVIWTRLTASEVRDERRINQFAIGMVEDITAGKQAEQRLRDSEERFRAITETAPDPVVSIDESGRILSANPATERIFGYCPADLLGRRISVLIPRPLRQLRGAGIDPRDWPHNDGASQSGVEINGRSRTGSAIPLEASFGAFVQAGRRHFTCFLRDITERERAQEELRYQALHDSLTGLPNRSLLRERLEHMLALARRNGTSCALLLMDLDRFKEINDTFGHPYGDAVLQQLAARLLEGLRASDTVARLGGDEFAVLLPESTVEGAAYVSSKILQLLANPFDVHGQCLHVDASVGIALYAAHLEDDLEPSNRAVALMRQADVAMYVAKRSQTHVAVYDAVQDEESQRRIVLGGALRQAIDGGQLVLHYQPKADCHSRQIVGVEALVRWRHAELGMIPPDEFIPLAENSGLIMPLTHWVINEALHQASLWRAAGHEMPVWVNLSARTLHDRELPGMIEALLRTWSASADWLGLEVTESAVMADPDRALDILQTIHAMGIRIAIDDFGTGYSSLGYLQRLPVTELKIDRSFVIGMAEDRSDSSIVQATIGLAHDLDLKVVAEGVEHQEAWDFLDRLECDLVQGYYLCRPLAADDLMVWLAGRAEGCQIDHTPRASRMRVAG